MGYEPGTSECRLLIDTKAQIEAALANLARLEHTEALRSQLLAVYNALEDRHDIKRAERLNQPATAGAGTDGTA